MNEDFNFTKVSLSETFITRSRCKFCAGFPTYFFQLKNNIYYVSPQAIKDRHDNNKANIIRLCADFYLDDQPSDYHTLYFYNHSVYFCKFKIKMHKSFPQLSLSKKQKYVLLNKILTCECGKTAWAFSNLAQNKKKSPESYCSRSNKQYPKKFSI